MLTLLILGLTLLSACADNTATITPTTIPVTTAVPTTTAPVTTTRATIATPGLTVTLVTPPPLGIAEGVLKATGFNGEEAKTLLNELTQQIGTRVVGSENEQKAASWLEKNYKLFGYTRLERQEFPFPQREVQNGVISTQGINIGHNVIAIRPGPKSNSPVLIFGGHYDSVANTVGASDNGSGTVITLELAKVLFKKFPDYELRFINFSGEEIGLIGSDYYVSRLSAEEKKRITAFIDVDAVGVGDRFVAIGSPELVRQAVDIATQNGIRLEAFDLGGTGAGSDHDAFIQNGVKALMLGRWIDPELHRPGDTANRVYSEALLLGGGTAILTAQRLIGG